MTKFLYTDIDGVLCLDSEVNPKNTKWGMIWRFNRKAVKIYNEILEETGAQIIISSDWSNHHTLSALQEIFEWQGIIRKPIDVTEHVPFTSLQFLERDRAKEILNHVEKHKPDTWVAIDDLNLTDWWTGVEVKHYDKEDYKNDPHFVWLTRGNEGIKQSSKKQEIIKKLSL